MGTSKRITQRMIIFVALVVLVLQALMFGSSRALAFSLDITARADKSSYYIREPVRISGSLSQNGNPATGCFLAVQVNNRRGYPLLFRTVQVGDVSQSARAQIDQISVTTDPGLKPTDTVSVNSMANLNVGIRNLQASSLSVVVTATVFDGNLVPIFAQSFDMTGEKALGPNQNVTVHWSMWVPGWAYCGKAFAAIGLYSDLPENWGVNTGAQYVYAPEAQYTFYLARNPLSGHPHSVLPTANTSGLGWYEIYFRMPPDALTQPGSYRADVVASQVSSPYLHAETLAEFSLNDWPAPPNAAFTYLPLKAYENMLVTLDGSSSSAEGYNTTITEYDWTIDDPYNPEHIINTGDFAHPPPANATHVFSVFGTYMVNLKVTDNQGLYSTQSKPVTILPEFGPKANFTWTPMPAGYNQTVIFNASESLAGWSKQIGDYSPITGYTWYFGDTTSQPLSDSTVQHKFVQPGNFTVQLTITDSAGRTDSVSQDVQVINRTKPYDLNGDGKVDMKDIAIVSRAFGATPGSPNWNPVADINGDGKVDMKDIAPVARVFGT